ncbi:MAG: hypothetical protein LBK03_07780 [Bacteroidales bacterium]|jgi:hypothetical protein|nr:hypothetical protein [Bacteroidales bacterium]
MKKLILFLIIGLCVSSCYIVKLTDKCGHSKSSFRFNDCVRVPCKYCQDSATVLDNAEYFFRKAYYRDNWYIHYKVQLKEYGDIFDIKYDRNDFLDSVANSGNRSIRDDAATMYVQLLKTKCKIIKAKRWWQSIHFENGSEKHNVIAGRDLELLQNAKNHANDTLITMSQLSDTLPTVPVTGNLHDLLCEQNIISRYSMYQPNIQQDIINNAKKQIQIYLIGKISGTNTLFESFLIIVNNGGWFFDDYRKKAYLINIANNQLASIVQVASYYESKDKDYYYYEYTINGKNGHYVVKWQSPFNPNDEFARSFSIDYSGHVSVK